MKRYMTCLLSLLPLSCMVASKRDLANTSLPFFSNPESYWLESFTNQQMNIEINIPRGQSMSSSLNNSRKSSIQSNVSFMAYADRIKALVNNPIWARQVESVELQSPFLSYATVNKRTNVTTSIALVVKPTHVPHVTNTNNICILQDPIVINNICTSQGLEPLVIPYTSNQPANPQLWVGSFCPISHFEMNKYLKGDAKNITYSLLKIVAFLRQHKLKDKTAKDIPQISKFSFMAWDFLSAI